MKILVADDEEIFRKLVVDFLKKDGYEVVEAVDGKQALFIFQTAADIDLCVLDVMMPEINGLDVCRRIKTAPKQCPVLILTAKDSDEDQIEALKAGADDYIPKPFSFPILLLRIKNLLKRAGQSEGIIISGVLTVNVGAHKVSYNEEALDLTPKEFEVLVYLLKNKGNVISREMILEKVWGYDYFGDNRTVDTHIKNIRAKTSDDLIKTVRGYGYVIN